jgi:hypothetical protein
LYYTLILTFTSDPIILEDDEDDEAGIYYSDVDVDSTAKTNSTSVTAVISNGSDVIKTALLPSTDYILLLSP